jgi:PAS domain S-box-containing protein
MDGNVNPPSPPAPCPDAVTAYVPPPDAAAALAWAELFASTPLALAVVDPGTARLVYGTPAFAAMHGYAADAVAGLPVVELYAPDARPEMARQAARVDTERAVSFRTHRRRRDGSTFPARVDARAVTDAAGRLLYRAVTVEDLTASEATAAAQAHLAAIVASSEDAIVGKTLDGTITSWNAAAERLLGYTAAEIVGASVLRLIPPELQAQEPAILARLAAGERVATFETVRVGKDGARRHVSLSVSPVRDAAGQVIGAAKILRDVTAQKEAEASERFLLEAGARLAQSLDADATVRTLGRLAVETLADGCLVTLLDDAAAARGAYPFVHVDVASRVPGRAALVREIERRYPLPPDAPSGFPRAIRTGAAELVPDGAFDDAVLPSIAVDAEHLALLRRLEMRSAVVAPLVASGRTLGAITLVRHGPDRRPSFTERDLRVAIELGRRAGAAMDNARLYAAERRARADAERAGAQLAAVLDSMGEAFYGYDRDWRFTRLNRAARDTLGGLGIDADTLLGRVLWDVFPALVGTEYERTMRQVMEARAAAEFTERDLHRERWLETRVFPTPDGVAAYTLDVTARVVADQQRDLLVRVGELVSLSLEPARTLDAIARAPLPSLADYAIVDLLEGDGTVRRAAGAHADPAQAPLVERVLAAAPRLDSDNFVAGVLRTGRPALAPETTPEMIARVSDDPAFLDAVRALGPRSHLCVPLVARGRTLGSLLLVRTAAGRPFTGSELPVAEEIARRAALALDHARLYATADAARAEAEAARTRVAFLAAASERLAVARDVETTLRTVAELAVPALADWCFVEARADDGGIRPVAVVHRDPAKVALAHELLRRYPLDPDAPFGTGYVLRTGEPQVAAELTDALIASVARDAEHLALLRSLGMRASLAVPIRGGDGRPVAVLTLVSGDPARRVGPADLATAEEVARRAEVALAGARLYAAEQAALRRAMVLQQVTAALSGALTLGEAAAVVVAQCTSALGARGGVVVRPTDDGSALEVVRAVGYEVAADDVLAPIPLDAVLPLPEAFRRGEPVFVASTAEWDRRYGGGGALRRLPGSCAWMALPLVVDGRALGAMGLSFAREGALGDEDRALAVALAQQCAQAFERARLFEAERAARREAERASRAKSEFLATMSHELRTPLNAIGGYAELLEMEIRGPVTAAQREDLGRIQRSRRHLLGLINEVLDYARIERGAVAFDLRPTLLAEAGAAAAVLIEPQRAAKRIALEFRPPVDDAAAAPALAAVADPERLRQILLNLLSNAVKFTPEGGRVTVEIAPGPDARGRAIARVIDTGVGIPADQLEAIFEPFVQVGRAFNRPAEGTGLGLAISRDLARGMGGDLTAESTVGAGSTFTLALPAAPAADGVPG